VTVIFNLKKKFKEKISCCSRRDNQPQENLAKYGYKKRNKKFRNPITC
jgi:hypothetical protein